MIERPDPEKLLAGPLGAWLNEQATVRRDAQALAMSRWFRAALFGLPFLAWGNAPRRKAIKTVKIGINEAIAKALDLTYACDVQPGPGYDLACKYRLLPGCDRSKFEDLWSGTLDDRALSLHEAHLEERRGSGDNRRYVTVFRGAVMSIDFTRNFHGTTLVERAKQHRGLFGGRKERIELNGQGLDYVDLVNPDFEDEFCVYADDQVEARYLVHPAYVERLMKVQHAFAGHAIRTLFCGGNLVVVVETENMFESGSIDAADDRSRLVRTIDQFASIADLAETLNEPERGVMAG
jgi:hypothetical protein